MKKFYSTIVICIALCVSMIFVAWNDNGNNNGGYGYYGMGPGMMYGYGNGPYGGGMMGDYWQDNDNYRNVRNSLNLSGEQQSRWDNAIESGRSSQRHINDSINHYVNQIRRLEKSRSPYIQQDIEAIKQILTPDQYTRFLEKLLYNR